MHSDSVPKISIVSPSFNQGEFIEDAILSVLNQNYENFEHIIIDAGSTDETLSILRKYPHLIWVSEKDKGQSDAINKGVIKATGDWILWLNVDDIMLKDSFKYFLDAYTEDPSIEYVYGHTLFVNSDKKPLRLVTHIPYYYYYSMGSVYMPPSTGSFIKAEFFKNNLLDVDYHVVMDNEWFLRCGKKMKTKLIRKPLSAFRISENNKTAKHILHNQVSDQHQAERNRSTEKYIDAYYPFNSDDTQTKAIKFLFRKGVKISYYLNKLIFSLSNFKNLSNYENSLSPVNKK